MRDLLLLGIILVSLPFALRHTWIAVSLWTWVSLMNPHRLAFGFVHDAPVAAVVAGTALLSLVVTRDKLRMPWSPPVVVLFFFVLWMCVTTVFAIDPAGSATQLNRILKVQVMTAVALLALHERKHIQVFIWVNVLSIAYFGVKGGMFTILKGGALRVWGPAGSFIEENNALAVATIMIIPLIYYLRTVSSRAWMRLGLLGMMLLCAFSALGSQSRGALIAVSAMTLVLWYRSQKKFALGIGLVVVAASLLAFMPSSWEERMGTIQTYEEDQSAMGRIHAWQTAINVANNRPFGAGFEMYDWGVHAMYSPPATEKPRAAHSIYFSVLGEHGYVGLFLYLLMWWLVFRLAGRMRKETKGIAKVSWVYELVGMCQVSLVGFFVGGAFLSLAYFDLPFNILVILVVTQRWLNEGGWKNETVAVPGSRDSSCLSAQTNTAALPVAK
ncbi:MAG: putative O-glycosylation ligase, exosortase A-associated [Candidatus Accumulibacter appositus]|uniref:Putative O-glycosylation ligase, exosortase A-associated n=1 Tax=Candidatus Accumulibacter appositus TaxID=1454003 RepID=A0A011PK69_9PROT|nr:putative O-glycosylation ligase, exosortase A system-associated [Accumulibacter sp.]EXI77240.1 MAG: putative O-glycosylation ligase, exosortase A-associated [Candidatus Accumulibacter appositus]HRF03996.1 putative O-glycosylation ligase, exosortase A system-associated [Accumulibacter sp.]